MEKARGMPEVDRGAQEDGAPSIPSGPGSASPVPRFVVLNGHGGRDPRPPPPAVVSEHVHSLPKQPFTVRLKNNHEWTAARRPHETLQHFVAEVHRNAHLLHLIDDDERVLRLQLPGTPPKDLDVDATLGDVRICMRDDDPVLLAVIAKLPTGTIPAPMIPEMNRDQADATVVWGAPKRKDQPSSGAPSPLQERSVAIKRRVGPDLRVTESDLTSNMHLTLLEKAESLSISLTALKHARIELGMGRWLGRQERARLRRLRGPSEDSRGSPSAVAEPQPVAKPEQTEGHEGLRSLQTGIAVTIKPGIHTFRKHELLYLHRVTGGTGVLPDCHSFFGSLLPFIMFEFANRLTNRNCCDSLGIYLANKNCCDSFKIQQAQIALLIHADLTKART